VQPDVSTLFGESVNFEHEHPLKPLDLDDVHEQQFITQPVDVTGDYTLTELDVYVNVSDPNATIRLPAAGAGLEYHITKTVPGGAILLLPNGTDTILGKTGWTITQQWTSLHLKADTGNWIFV